MRSNVPDDIDKIFELLVIAKDQDMLYDVDTQSILTTSEAQRLERKISEQNFSCASTFNTLKRFLLNMKDEAASRYYEAADLKEFETRTKFTVIVKPKVRHGDKSSNSALPEKSEWLEMGRRLINIAKRDGFEIIKYSYASSSNEASLTLFKDDVAPTDVHVNIQRLQELYHQRSNIMLEKFKYFDVTLSEISAKLPEVMTAGGVAYGHIKLIRNYSPKSFAIIGDIDRLSEVIRSGSDLIFNKFLSVGPGYVGPSWAYEKFAGKLRKYTQTNQLKFSKIDKAEAERDWQQAKIEVGMAYNPSSKDEDRAYTNTRGNKMFLGLFDGHGGSAVVDEIIENIADLESLVTSFPRDEKEAKAASEVVFRRLDDKLRKVQTSLYEGSTAVVATLNISTGKIFFYTLGDSRAVWRFEEGGYVWGTEDQNPEDEVDRIVEAGGEVVWTGKIHRVNGELAMARAFGDFSLKRDPRNEKQYKDDPVSRVPEVYGPLRLRQGASFVMASDGLWDVMSNEEVMNMISSISDSSTAAQTIVDHARELGSGDDITAIVVRILT